MNYLSFLLFSFRFGDGNLIDPLYHFIIEITLLSCTYPSHTRIYVPHAI